MLDVTSVGSDLTPAQLEETLSDLAFFLDTFGSTRAVRAKLRAQESDIKRLDRKVLLPRDKNLHQSEEEEKEEEREEREEQQREGQAQEGVDETMVDVDFFLRTFGSTRAVREKLEAQSQRIVGLQHTAKWLQERWKPTEESCDDSRDVEYLGTGPASKADITESGISQDEDEDVDGRTTETAASMKSLEMMATL